MQLVTSHVSGSTVNGPGGIQKLAGGHATELGADVELGENALQAESAVVKNESQLQAALANEAVGIIKLGGDITVTDQKIELETYETLKSTDGRMYTLALDYPSDTDHVQADGLYVSGSSVTVKDLNVTTSTDSSQVDHLVEVHRNHTTL